MTPQHCSVLPLGSTLPYITFSNHVHTLQPCYFIALGEGLSSPARHLLHRLPLPVPLASCPQPPGPWTPPLAVPPGPCVPPPAHTHATHYIWDICHSCSTCGAQAAHIPGCRRTHWDEFPPYPVTLTVTAGQSCSCHLPNEQTERCFAAKDYYHSVEAKAQIFCLWLQRYLTLQS